MASLRLDLVFQDIRPPEDFSPALKVVMVLLASETKMNFHRGASPDGIPWVPLKRPRKKGQTRDKPLRDRGLLMASASANTSGPGAVRDVTTHSLEYGSSLHYGGYHQTGTEFIPQRQWLGMTEATADKVARIVADFVAKGLTGG